MAVALQRTPTVPSEAMGAAPSLEPGGRVGTFVLLRRWQDYLDVSGRANPRTRQQYSRRIVAFCADTLLELEDVSTDDVVAYLRDLDPHGQTRGMVLRALRSFYGWAAERELIVPNPVGRLRVPRPKYGDAPALSPDELEAVLKAAERIDPRARPALDLAYATGARLGSLAAIMPEDVDLGRNWLAFRVAKNGDLYGVPLGDRGRRAAEQLLALMAYTPTRVRTRRPTLIGVGESTISSWAKRAGEDAGVKTWTHLLRHTFATRLAENPEVDIRTWVELMNHRDGSLLRRYARKSDPRLRQAVAPL